MNYAKWANASFDDEDEDDKPRRPRVTRLEGPSTITLGAPEPTATAASAQAAASTHAPSPKPATVGAKKAPARFGLDYSKWDALALELDDDEEGDGDDDDGPMRMDDEDDFEDPLTADEQRQLGEALKDAGAEPPPPPPPQKSAAALFDELHAKATRNGASREAYLWRQSESEVELGVYLSPGTRARDLRPVLREADLAAGTKQVLAVHRAGSSGPGAAAMLFEGRLAYPVAQPTAGTDESPESSVELSWEVTDFEPASLGGRRLLRVTLAKEMPHGVVVWWERAIEGEAGVDTTNLPDRKRAALAAKHQTVWEEAQRLFRQKVAERSPPMVIDSGTADDNDDDDNDDEAAAEEAVGEGAAGGGEVTALR